MKSHFHGILYYHYLLLLLNINVIKIFFNNFSIQKFSFPLRFGMICFQCYIIFIYIIKCKKRSYNKIIYKSNGMS